MNEKRKSSYLISSKESSTLLRTCTPCCPFDAKNLPHPQFNYSSINPTDTKENRILTNSNACCLSKLQVECRIQCDKKKKKKKYNKMKKNKRYNSIHSSQSTKQSISSSSSSAASSFSSSQLSSNRKRKKFSSSTNINSHYIHDYDCDTQTSSSSYLTSSNTSKSEITERSYSSNKMKRKYRYYDKSTNAQQYHRKSPSQLHVNQNIRNLKSSIDNLTQLLIHHQNSSQRTLLSNQLIPIPPISFIDKFLRFFTLFKSSSKSNGDQINEECNEILKRNHLTKENLLNIYHLFDKNENIFLNWLRTIIPESFLPLLLNYVKHFDSISTDKE